MSSLNLNRFCSTKQNGWPGLSPSSGKENSYWLITHLKRWRRTKRSWAFGSTGGGGGGGTFMPAAYKDGGQSPCFSRYALGLLPARRRRRAPSARARSSAEACGPAGGGVDP